MIYAVLSYYRNDKNNQFACDFVCSAYIDYYAIVFSIIWLQLAVDFMSCKTITIPAYISYMVCT